MAGSVRTISGPSRILLLGVLAAVAVACLTAGMRWRARVWIARSWTQVLQTVPDDQVPAVIDQIARLDSQGVGILVQALDSPREAVVVAAKRALWDRIVQCERLRGRQSARKAVALAETLASHVERLSPAAQSHAADLAARILAWPVEDALLRTRRVMPACELVIRTAAAARPNWVLTSNGSLFQAELAELPRLAAEGQAMPKPGQRGRTADILSGGTEQTSRLR